MTEPSGYRPDAIQDWTTSETQSAPVYWPALTADQAAEEWNALRVWVTGLCERFPHSVRVPPCWWRHNDLVEILSALRDYERACFAKTAAATAAVDWHRAYRDIEVRLEMWIKRLSCGVPGRGHEAGGENAWVAFVDADVAARRDEQV